MEKTVLILPSGREISSGLPGDAIAACELTQCVNAGTELTLGSVCAAMVRLQLFASTLHINEGDRLVLCRQEGQSRRLLGVFYAGELRRTGDERLQLTAYDAVSLLEKDVSQWLQTLQGWPYTMYDLAQMTCVQCGVELADRTIPNGQLLVEKFSFGEVTGRQLLQWIAQAAGRFCRATATGKLEFAWYTALPGHSLGPSRESTAPGPLEAALTEDTLCISAAGEGSQEGLVAAPDISGWLSDDGTLTLTGLGGQERHPVLSGTLRQESYQVQPIGKVQLRKEERDVGLLWPNDPTAQNTYIITGNPMLAGADTQALRLVGRALFEQLRYFTYRPFTGEIPACADILPGHIISVTDKEGETWQSIVMTKVSTGGRDKLSCTGSERRDSVSAVNERTYTALPGKVFRLQCDVDGLLLQNQDADGRLSQLSMTVDRLQTQLQQQTGSQQSLQTQLTQLQQTATELALSVQTVRQQGASKVRTSTDYTFDEQGLRIAREGQTMENRLDNEGMTVSCLGQTILAAHASGVQAVDVQVNNYLCVGDNARFEDYEAGRTACFYTGG